MKQYLLVNDSEGINAFAEQYRLFDKWSDCRKAATDIMVHADPLVAICPTFERAPIRGNAIGFRCGSIAITAMTIEAI